MGCYVDDPAKGVAKFLADSELPADHVVLQYIIAGVTLSTARCHQGCRALICLDDLVYPRFVAVRQVGRGSGGCV